MAFRIFAFHFDPAYDVAGFLGWLHAHLARATGAGHIVVCVRWSRAGGNHTRGGIFEPTNMHDVPLSRPVRSPCALRLCHGKNLSLGRS